ncbi:MULTISPECIES: phosphonate C-P lyase system protein PhnH [Paenibacillus]|uniref:phosphonate C-P lyase system protein PhnH n=1 Tax=Paenibacillus TaxID=44249 RepID=UPI0011A896D9|nr:MULTISPECIES: phosphonate C-P lyase system protein PhnH [Paenibacillus]MBJ9988084.1 phosphonate C-P lyase system protein PhnH [Paenibacillus sp. S28]
MNFDAVHDIQRAYRKVVDSMSRPGLISDLTAEAAKADGQWGGLPVTWVLALMLLDTEVTFCICSQREAELTRLLNQLTFAVRTEPEKADYIFVLHDAKEGDLLKALQGAKVGTLADPHASATVIVELEELSGDFELSLKGPGIEDESFVRIPLAPGWLEARAEKNAEYPLGIDMLVVDKNNKLLCLPRTTQIEEREVLLWDM